MHNSVRHAQIGVFYVHFSVDSNVSYKTKKQRFKILPSILVTCVLLCHPIE